MQDSVEEYISPTLSFCKCIVNRCIFDFFAPLTDAESIVSCYPCLFYCISIYYNNGAVMLNRRYGQIVGFIV